jgi:hypothetical protein
MSRRLSVAAALLWFLVPPLSSAADPPTPRSVVEAFAAMYASLSDYQCRMDEQCWQGRRFEERTINFYFKKPRLIRMDILRGNRFGDTGSVGVYRGDGRVRGRKGGLLGFLAITVDKHDPQATTVRGLAFDESALQATLEKLRFHLAQSACALSVVGGRYELVFEPRDPSVNRGVTRDVIRLDAATLLPASSDSWEGERLVQHAQWSSYIIDAGLPDQLFDVFWDPGQLERMGIRSIHALPLP